MRLIEALSGEILLYHSLFRHVSDSLCRWIMAFAVATIAGLAFGLAAGWWPAIEKLPHYPYILQLIPGFAWIPVAILMFGVGCHIVATDFSTRK